MAKVDLLDRSAVELSELVRTRAVSPVELAEQAIARAEASQASLNAFQHIRAERALADARRAEDEIVRGDWRGPLHGLPYAAKDLIATRDAPTTMGSRLFDGHLPDRDAAAVERLRARGAILVGKTTTSEFGHKPLTEGPLFGRTVNPIDPSVTCGGSSGGSAVAVASWQVPLALGTDGGGSVRIPAACCGVVGLKATLGAIPHLDVPDLFGANSYVGPMARTVAELRLLFDGIRGFDRRDPFGQGRRPELGDARTGVRDLRIGWMETVGNPEVDPGCAGAARRAVDGLAARGAAVEEARIDFAALEGSFLVVLQSALRSRLLPQREARPDLLDPTLVRTLDLGAKWSAVDLQRACARKTACFLELQALFERFDVLASPTLAAPPLSADQDPHGRVAINGRDAGSIRGAWYPYTYPLNLTGHPALSVPCGRTSSGLPLGLQLAGPWHSDDLLLQVAAEVEEAARVPAPE